MLAIWNRWDERWETNFAELNLKKMMKEVEECRFCYVSRRQAEAMPAADTPEICNIGTTTVWKANHIRLTIG